MALEIVWFEEKELVSNLEKWSGADISHKSFDSTAITTPQRTRKVLFAQFARKTPSLSLSLSLCFTANLPHFIHASLAHLSSLSSEEAMWLIKGKLFKGRSTFHVLFWPKNCISFSPLIISASSPEASRLDHTRIIW